jgi:hypothetical protein
MSSVEARCRGCGGGVPSGRVLRARTGSDLAALTHSWGRYERIDLLTDELDSAERERWEARLLAAYGECGCHAGGAAVLLTLAALATVATTRPVAWTWAWAGLGIGAVLAAALAGKLVGVAVARIRLRDDIRRVRAFLG